MSTSSASRLGVALALTLLGSAASASVISVGNSFNPVLQVDSSTGTTSLLIGAGGVINDVNVFIDFTKCDNPISSTGDCLGTGSAFAREIEFFLTSPNGTTVALVVQDTYFSSQSGPAPGARVGVLFDDEAALAVGGNALVSGTFRPVGSLSALDGEVVTGNWTLTFRDTVGADPMSLNAWRLDIAVPEPATMALLGLGLVGAGLGRRRRS